MRDDIYVRGVYRYSSRVELERALADARALLDDDDEGELDRNWLDRFVRKGVSLRVDAVVPSLADRYLTAEILRSLSNRAIDGVVETSHAGHCLDWFPSLAGDPD